MTLLNLRRREWCGWSRFAERIKVSPVRVPGSHESMFTRPAELAGALAQVATAPVSLPFRERPL